MSRCLLFPPPGYTRNALFVEAAEALIDSIKLKKEDKKFEKERKKQLRREKKKRKQLKTEKYVQLFGSISPCKKLKTADTGVVEVKEKSRESLLEKSGVTEEHAQTICSQLFSESSDNTHSSYKRKRVSNDQGNVLRFPSQCDMPSKNTVSVQTFPTQTSDPWKNTGSKNTIRTETCSTLKESDSLKNPNGSLTCSALKNASVPLKKIMTAPLSSTLKNSTVPLKNTTAAVHPSKNACIPLKNATRTTLPSKIASVPLKNNAGVKNTVGTHPSMSKDTCTPLKSTMESQPCSALKKSILPLKNTTVLQSCSALKKTSLQLKSTMESQPCSALKKSILPLKNTMELQSCSTLKKTNPPLKNTIGTETCSKPVLSSKTADLSGDEGLKNVIRTEICSPSGRTNLSNPLKNAMETEKCSTSGRTEAAAISNHGRAKRKSNSRADAILRDELAYNQLFENLVPPTLQNLQPSSESGDDMDWLFKRPATKKICRDEGEMIKSSSSSCSKAEFSLSTWPPKAQFLPEANIYALPYTVLF